MENNTCCFIGHRAIFEYEELPSEIYEIVERLIVEEKVDTFFFGSKSRFNTVCLEVVTKIKEKYPFIKRVYVRAEYQYISDDYKKFLLQNYEDTYYPEKIRGSGRAAYIERNYEMINNSRFCVIYYNKDISPLSRNGGTEIALKYAKKLGKEIINVAEW